MLLAILIALLLPFAWGFFRKKGSSAPTYIVYTVIFETVPEIADSLAVGDALTDARAKGSVGEILALTRERLLCEDASGVYAHPERVSLALTVGANGSRRGRDASIGDFTPRVGERVDLYGGARLSGLCIRVRAI